jgi:photosystem II stability/assembly factor-like uncharacterized protein
MLKNMTTRRELLLSSASLLLTNKASAVRLPHGSLGVVPSSHQWESLKVGGGGLTRDLDIAPDGTKVCKIDVYGAYVWNPNIPSTGNAGGMGMWEQLCASGRIPVGDPAFNPRVITDFHGGLGAWDVRIAPSNSSVIYMLWAGMMYKSTNKGVTFVNQTDKAGGTFPRQTLRNCNPNSAACGPGPPMAIDPQNPNVCWVGTFGGIWFTQNGGTTWTKISTSKLPLPKGSYAYGLAFDPVSTVTGGLTQGIYCWVHGSGVYHSSNAGANWTLLSGSSFSGTMPVNCVRIVVDKFGVAWVCADTNSPNVLTFTVQSGTAFAANMWHALTATGYGANYPIWSVAPDPASSTSAGQRVIVASYDGSLAQTTDGGATWTPNQGEKFNQVATDCPWLETDERYMTMNGCMRFDPSQMNALYFPEGIGVWVANPPTIGNSSAWPAWTWNSQTVGIESLETTYIISPPGGGVGLIQWDRNWFLITDRTKFPTSYGTWPGGRANSNLNQSVIFGGNGADWAGGNPSFIALACAGSGGSTAGQKIGSGFSTNGGVPVTGWSFFANPPPGLVSGSGSASMAVSTSTSMMLVANGLFATTDGGATAWTNVTPAGSSGWTNGFAQISQPLAADKVTAGYYVAVAKGKIYRTSNTGESWTTVTPLFSLGRASGGDQLKAVPNNAGHYFYTAGASFGPTVDLRNVFYRTTDGGQTWRDVSRPGYFVREVWVWGYGASNGGSYPAIFIYGYVNAVLGVWQSTDNCVSWQKIGDAQFGGKTFDTPNCMAGDMNTPGVVYVGFLGSGYLQYS